MVRLEEIVPGSRVRGIASRDFVEILAARSFRPDAVEVTYKGNGTVDQTVLYRSSEVGERARTLTLSQLLCSKRDPVKGIAHHSKIVTASAGDGEAGALSIEQLNAKLSLQRFHLMADRSLCDTQLLRGAREALMPSRRVKGSERVKRGKRTAHDRHS